MPVDFEQEEEVLQVFWTLLYVVVRHIFKLDVCSFESHDFLKKLTEHDLKRHNLDIERLVVVSE